MMRSDMGKQMRGPRVPMPSPVQGGGMTRPSMPGKPDMIGGGTMQRPVTPGPGTTPPGGMMAQETVTPAVGNRTVQRAVMPGGATTQAFKKGGMVSAKKARGGSSVSVRGRGCEVRGTKACKMS